MSKSKKVGYNFLHTHAQTEKSLNLDEKHVIVDRDEWEQVVNYFMDYPDEAKRIGVRKRLIDVS
jgi:hypothetical protein